MAAAEEVIERSGVSIDATEFRGATFLKMPCPMRTLIGSRAEAITLGNRVFIHAEIFDDVVSGARPDLVVHELVHVSQWRAEGGSFLPRYLGQYFHFRFLGVSHHAAYRAISYEMEAYAASVSS